jgi:hypothetical protein
MLGSRFADAAPLHPVDLLVQQGGSEQVECPLHLGVVDVLALTGAGPLVEGAEDGGQGEAG